MSQTQTLVVDGVISSANWGTPTTAILASIDGSEINGSTTTDHNLHVSFDAPNQILEGTTQTIRVEAARVNNKASTPTLKIELWENGSLVTAGSVTNVTSEVYSEFTLVFSAADLTGDGTNVEIKLFGTASGSGGTKNGVAIDRIIIDAVIADTPAAPQLLKFGVAGTIDNIMFGTIQVQAVVFEDNVVWGSLGGITHEWNFDDSIVPVIGSITFSGTPTYHADGALTHNGVVALVLSASGISLPAADDWSICLIYREHGTDGSGFSFPLVFNGSGSGEGLSFFTNSATESDGSVTSYGWIGDGGADGDATAAATGLASTNINTWVKILITNTASTAVITADGTNTANLNRPTTPAVLTSILAQEHTGSQNFEGDFAYLAISTDTVLTYGDFPTIASLPQCT